MTQKNALFAFAAVVVGGGILLLKLKLTKRPSPQHNKQVVLASRPNINEAVSEANMRFETCEMPGKYLKPGEIVYKLLALSVDPYLRCRFNEDPGADYLTPFQINQPLLSGAVGVVLASKNEEFPIGAVFCSQMQVEWKLYNKIELPNELMNDVRIVNTKKEDPLLSISTLGLSGLSAYHLICDASKPVATDVVVLSSCAGAVGSISGMILKNIYGCKVIGICGSHAKCDWCKNELLLDHAICYRDSDFEQQLRQICDKKVTLYVDNVGGHISELVIEQMAPKSRVVICGQVSTYNQDTAASSDYVYPDPLPATLTKFMEENEITRERFFVGWYTEQHRQARKKLSQWIETGQLTTFMHKSFGLESSISAFVGMMGGANVGKAIVEIDDF